MVLYPYNQTRQTELPSSNDVETIPKEPELYLFTYFMHAMKRFLTIWIFHVGDEKNIHGDQHTRQQRHE
jgi:hypothetical protein